MKTNLPGLLGRGLGSALVAALVAALLLAGYDRWVVQPALLIGVIDVGEVYRQKEAEFTRLLTHSSSDEERQQALAMARAFAQRLPLALDELTRECGCLVVVNSAVAAPAPRTLDLTARLQQKVARP